MSQAEIDMRDAAEEGSLGKLEAAMRTRPKPTKDMLTYPLSIAARKGDETMARFLLDHGAKIAPYTQVGARSTAVLQALLDHGWDINSEYADKKTPL